ncbi:hypothetical protein CR513_49173, partial [Mucuna pruriens]
MSKSIDSCALTMKVLHAPKLANNLITLHRLIQDWNCKVRILQRGGQLKLLKSNLSKHHYATFCPSYNKSLIPLYLIHPNVCGETLRASPNILWAYDEMINKTFFIYNFC